MKIHSIFTKTFGLTIFIFSAIILFSACTLHNSGRNEIDLTVVPEYPTIKDEFMTVPMDELPFRVQIPSGWTFIESGVYELVFDQGASGNVQFSKTQKYGSFDELTADGYKTFSGAPAGFEILFKDAGDPHASTRYFALKLSGSDTVYSMTLTNKTLTTDRLSEVDQIIQSLRAD